MHAINPSLKKTCHSLLHFYTSLRGEEDEKGFREEGRVDCTMHFPFPHTLEELQVLSDEPLRFTFIGTGENGLLEHVVSYPSFTYTPGEDIDVALTQVNDTIITGFRTWEYMIKGSYTGTFTTPNGELTQEEKTIIKERSKHSLLYDDLHLTCTLKYSLITR